MESTGRATTCARGPRARAVLASLSALALALAVWMETGGPASPPKCPGIDPELCDPAPA